MGSSSALYQHLLWVSIPLLCLSVVLLVKCIVNVVRLIRRSLILRVPLLDEQWVYFHEAGRVVLCTEGPRASRRFARLAYSLEAEDGAPVRLRRRWFRAVTSGVSTARMELHGFRIERPGRYLCRIEGLPAEEAGSVTGDSNHFVVFMKPHLVKSLGYVLGITLTAGASIVSVVFTLLRLTQGTP